MILRLRAALAWTALWAVTAMLLALGHAVA